MAKITPAATKQPTVLVLTTVILPYSQTFIRDHVASLRRFRGVLVGFKKSSSFDLTGLETRFIGGNGAARWILYWLGYSTSLDQIIEETGASLIHCHFADTGALIARYCRRRRLPLIVTIHGSDVLRKRPAQLSSWLRNRLFRSCLADTTLFLAVSDWLLERSIDAGIPANKTRRHYLGIPLQPTVVQPQCSTHATILFVGRLVEKKGLTYLIDAVHLLWDQRRDFRVRIIGDGPLRAKMEAMATQFGLPITFTGACSSDQVRAEMDQADIFCGPSTAASDGDNEGLGLVFVEAQSRGLAVVSFDQGPIPEVVKNRRTGLLVADKDSQALAMALATLISNPTLRQQMGRDGRHLAEETFDIVRQTEKLEQFYEEIAAAAQARIPA